MDEPQVKPGEKAAHAPPQKSADSQRQQAENQARQEEMKNAILAQVLDQNARARLNTIMAANEGKGRQLEAMILRMATNGQIPGKMGDEQLKGLLSRIAEQTHRTTTVKFDRRRAGLDSDSD